MQLILRCYWIQFLAVSPETHPYPISWHPSIQGLHTSIALRTILLWFCLIYEVSIHPEMSISVRFPYCNRTCISQVICAMYMLVLHSYTTTFSLKTVCQVLSTNSDLHDFLSAVITSWHFVLSIYAPLTFFFYFSTIYTPGLRLTFSTCLNNVQFGNYSVKLRSIPVNTLSLWNS